MLSAVRARPIPMPAVRYNRGMCGRYALHSHPDVVALQFGLSAPPNWKPRYNIAPTQQAPVVRIDSRNQRELALLRWGLIPAWSKDASIGAHMINARAETVASKPAFRSAFRRHRCLVPADGYYEWKGEAGRKQPYLLRPAGDGPFAMAGLWEQWHAPDGGVVESFAIITTNAPEAVRTVHDRMPVIVSAADYEAWLHSPDAALLQPLPGTQFAIRPVSRVVNNARIDDERCIAAFEPGESGR